jgi:hypothetical protein
LNSALRTLAVVLVALASVPALAAHASSGGGSDTIVAAKLSNQDEYIDPAELASSHTRPGDDARLLAVTKRAAKQGVPAKVGIISGYDKRIRTPAEAAERLRNYIDFSGVLVLVSPRGVGVSSDYLQSSATTAIAARVQPRCRASYTACAIAAVNATVPRIKSAQAGAYRDVAIFWGAAVAIFGVIIVALVLWARRRQQDVIGRWREEAAPAGEQVSLPPE